MAMYQVSENINGKRETYMIGFETENELTSYLNGKRIWINEKKDSIVAWKVNADGNGYINLERIWKLYSRKAVKQINTSPGAKAPGRRRKDNVHTGLDRTPVGPDDHQEKDIPGSGSAVPLHHVS